MDNIRPYDLYISYAAADAGWVEGFLLDALKSAGANYITDATFALGTPRLAEKERAVRQSKYVVVVLSPSYMADGGAQFVDLLAQTHGLETATWPVIPLTLVEVTDPPPRLAMLNGLDATDPEDWQRVIARLCEEVQRPAPAPARAPACPYLGMVPFDEADSKRFFGREEEVGQIKGLLQLHPFLAVIGPSGSGKSSLIFAGLVPRLRESRQADAGGWLVRRMRPGPEPLTTLKGLFAGDPSETPASVAETLRAEPGARRMLLVVDQFEETFTSAVEEQAHAFQELLLRLVGTPDLSIVVTARADFYGELMASPLWPHIRANRFEVAPLGEAGLRQAIIRPAENVNVFVESALVERLLADAVGEPGVLPFVQETLVLLWEHVERRFLPLRAYETLVLPSQAYGGAAEGRLTGLQIAMARHAEVTLNTLDDRRQAITRRILLRLVQFGQGRPDTRRQQPVEALRAASDDPREFAETLGRLSERRLVTLGGEPQAVADISHEALINGWPTLRRWINERRVMEQARRRLQAKAEDWVRLEKKGGLLDEAELAEAERYMKSQDVVELGYDSDSDSLIKTSAAAIELARQREEMALRNQLALEQKALRAAQTRNRVAVVLAAFFSVAAVVALFQWQSARSSGRDALQQGLLNLSTLSGVQAASGQQLDALVSSLTAARRVREANLEGGPPIEVLLALQQSVYGIQERNRLQGHSAEVTSLSLSPDGETVLSASDDHLIGIWRADGRLITFVGGQGEAVKEVEFSPDGQTFVSAGMNPFVRLWDLKGNQRKVWAAGGEEVWVSSVTFSPDGQSVAAACSDGRVRLWNVEGDAPPKVFEGHQKKVFEVHFIPRSDLLASAGEDGTVIVWNRGGGMLKQFEAHAGAVFGLDASPDGQTLATAGEDGRVKLWTLDGSSKAIIEGSQGGVLNVRFSHDGRTVAAGGVDGAVRVWAIDGTLLHTLRGHAGNVGAVRFGRDDQTILSGGYDRSIRVWNLAGAARLDLQLGAPVNSVRFSPDSQLVVTGDDSGAVKLWRTDGTLFRTLGEHATEVLSVDFSADGRSIASGEADGTVRLWDLNGNGKMLGRHAGAVRAVAFGDGGRTLASAGADKHIKIWSREGELLKLIEAGEEVNGLSFGSDGLLLASVSVTGQVVLWNQDGTQRQALKMLGPSSGGVSFSPDGQWLAASDSNGTVPLWRSHGREFEDVPTPLFTREAVTVNNVAFSREATVIASADADGRVRFRGLDGRLLQSLRGHEDSVYDVRFSPDGKTLATAGGDGRVTLWNLDFDDLTSRGCGWVKDYLSTNATLTEYEKSLCTVLGKPLT